MLLKISDTIVDKILFIQKIHKKIQEIINKKYKLDDWTKYSKTIFI